MMIASSGSATNARGASIPISARNRGFAGLYKARCSTRSTRRLLAFFLDLFQNVRYDRVGRDAFCLAVEVQD